MRNEESALLPPGREREIEGGRGRERGREGERGRGLEGGKEGGRVREREEKAARERNR